MNKNILKSSALLTVAMIATPLLATNVSAATTTGGDYTSSANLTLQAGTGPVSPLDPTDPINPVTPVDPVTPGAAGNITVDYGSKLYFGTQSISTEQKVYYAQPDMVKDSTNTIKAVPNFSQVTDQSGELAGWTLTLTQESDLHLTTGTSTDPGYALTGAQISFAGGTVVGGNGITAGTPSDVVTSGSLTPGVATKLVSAAANEGAGTWLYNFGDLNDYDTNSVDLTNTSDHSKVATKSAISLTVPAGITEKAAAYTTNLYWSLQAVPGNAWTGNTSSVTN
ncbi:WxL domain-containing protein [Lactococcus sp.]|uniref:WxL domain-containing protein n=1 Tax=Lactococcus sp. TaxID=44273 RepID=UPI0035AEE994